MLVICHLKWNRYLSEPGMYLWHIMHGVLDFPLWAGVTQLTGFEKWYRDTFGDFIADESATTSSTSSSYSSPSNTSKSGGCYVATAVYGSYDCPQVWTLRRYRDFGLAEHWYGRAFIYIYYAISPSIVKWFGSYKWFNNIWRNKLDAMVEKLQKEGYESSPYSDREW